MRAPCSYYTHYTHYTNDEAHYDPHYVTGGKCTWEAGEDTRVKTIDSKCLLDLHGFKEACAADGRAPFPKATHMHVVIGLSCT